MITREELLKSSEYWTEIIQNKIYNDLAEFIEEHEIPNKQIAESLGLSKGRVSQILSGGNLNFRIDTLVKLCLTINKIPDFNLMDVNEFIAKDRVTINSIIFKETESSHVILDEMLAYAPGIRSNNYNINVNSQITVGNSIFLPETINPGSKAA
jgi:predicted XRE-type DNA-binding protein